MDVDQEIRQARPALYSHTGDRWAEYFDRSAQLIDQAAAASAEGLLLVDLGAGCLQDPRCRGFLAGCDHVLLVWAPPNEVHARHQFARRGYWRGRPLNEFRTAEYGPSRGRIYKEAKHTVDISGLGIQDAAFRFVEALLVISPDCAKDRDHESA